MILLLYFASTYAVASQAKCSVQSTPPLLEAGYAVRPDSLSVSRNPIGGPPLSSCTYNVVQTGSLSHVSEGTCPFDELAVYLLL